MLRQYKELDNGVTVWEFLPTQALKMAEYLGDKLDTPIVPHFMANPAEFWAIAGSCVEGLTVKDREKMGSSTMMQILGTVFSDEVNPGFLSLAAALAARPEAEPEPKTPAQT